MRALLKLLPRPVRWLVTVNATHTQVATAKLLCATLKSHYLMIVKSNQPACWLSSQRCHGARYPSWPPTTPEDTAASSDALCESSPATRGIGFPHAKQIIRITRERLIASTGQRGVEVVHAICSLSFEQAPTHGDRDLATLALGHREYVHWVRDVTFDEGRHHAHAGNSAQILATIRNSAINLHRLAGADNIAEACRATALTADRRLDLLNPNPS